MVQGPVAGLAHTQQLQCFPLFARFRCDFSCPLGQGCIRREGASEVALGAVRQAVGGGCRIGWRRLLSVLNAIEAGTCRHGDSGWAQAGRPGEGGGGSYLPPFQCIPALGPLQQLMLTKAQR